MALVGEKNVRNILIMKDYPNHATMSEARNAPIGDGVCVSSDGTAPANGEEFLVGVRNSKGTMTTFNIHPSRVVSGSSVKAVAAVARETTIAIPATPTAGELYEIRFTISGHGSFSAEDEYVKSAFYKVQTGDTDDLVTDGLIKSLYRNFQREEPKSPNTKTYLDSAAATHVLPDNNFFDFDSAATAGGTAEISTLQVTAASTEAGNIKLTLNGEDYYVPITVQTINQTAADIEAWIDANAPDHSASVTTDTVTITSDYERVEVDLAVDANGVATFAATAATTTPGVDGTGRAIVVTEKLSWLDDYYVTGRKTRLRGVYRVQGSFGDDTATVTESVVGVLSKGSGYDVRNMEEYLLGNRQDTFRGAGYPHNFPENYDSELDQTYHLVEIEYKDYGRDDEQIASKQSVVVAVKEAIGTFTKTNLLIADLNTAINGANGVTVGTLS